MLPVLMGVFALKNVRVFYKKKSLLRFISHLDMNRFMIRILRKTDIPIWYTEGFNTHPYITFALPLSLGFESDYEVMDIRLTDENYPLERVTEQLRIVMPEYIEVIKTDIPVMKPGRIAFAEFLISFDSSICDTLHKFFAQDRIVCTKKNKKGETKEIDISEKINIKNISCEGEVTKLIVILPAGSGENINPVLVIDALNGFCGDGLPCYTVTRTALYDDDNNLFK